MRAVTIDARADGFELPGPRAWSADAPPSVGGVNRLDQLTDGQRDCLRLVYRHMTSKDIARTLGVSPHTVDMRLRTAMRTLNVAGRIDAARLLVDSESNGLRAADVYQPLIYQSPELAGEGASVTIGAPVSTASDENAIHGFNTRIRPDVGPPAGAPPRPAGASQPAHPAPAYDVRYHGSTMARSLPWGDRNELGSGARLAWIALIAIGSALGFGAILGALEALKQLL